MGKIENRYKELGEFAKLRKTRLLDALALYKLFNDADSVEAWIDEKVRLKNFAFSKIFPTYFNSDIVFIGEIIEHVGTGR